MNGASTSLYLEPTDVFREKFFFLGIFLCCVFIYMGEKTTLSCLTAAIISTLSRQIINNPSEFMIKLIVSVFF